MAPRAIEDFNISMQLSLHGIGALLSYEEGAAEIIKVIGGGPAERDGRLQPGDRIVGVQQDGEEVVDILYWPLYKSVRIIRGEKGSKVILHVNPKSDASGSEVVEIDLIRDKIKLDDRAAKSRIKEFKGEGDAKAYKLGVIELPDFYADMGARRNGVSEPRSCATDVKKLLLELNEENVDGIVLDLRNNGGGSLPDCVELTGYFLEDGPIVQVKQGARRPRPLLDPNRDVVYKGPLVVLVNRQSASASEILAAALQDYGRAVIVGDSKTHGKGSVQTLYPLDRGNSKFGSIKVTTAGFFRVDGRSTQLKGVNPDIVIPSPMDALEIGEEFLDNVLPWEMVSAARYRPAGDLDDVIPDLADKSEARRKKSDEFAAQQDLIDRLKEKLEKTEISLNLEKRIALAKAEKELEHMQKKLQGDDEDDQETKDANDLVLGEGLHILRDIIALSSQI
jgi:carboxyl-terminal processing protease